ncbi:MAG: acyl-[acyl-carrier-protein]--UDP-N-acetylglucosamine O-acyltransferase, partial [Bacteroidales bacterium]|nr:acyl-[acyl-carrier-protein]--UDP-N-acetylglucosamine O-acyltransferase [Bacteroidales bacterium]
FPVSYCGVNSVGLSRRGFSNEVINNIQSLYRIVFQKGLTYSNALEELKQQPISKERDEIIAFMEASERGLMKGFTSVRK